MKDLPFWNNNWDRNIARPMIRDLHDKGAYWSAMLSVEVHELEMKNQSNIFLFRRGEDCLLVHIYFFPYKGSYTKPSELIASLKSNISFTFHLGLFLFFGFLKSLKLQLGANFHQHSNCNVLAIWWNHVFHHEYKDHRYWSKTGLTIMFSRHFDCDYIFILKD